MALTGIQASGVTAMEARTVTCWPGAQTALRKKLEDAKTERDRSQNSDDVRAHRDEISELRCAHACTAPVTWTGPPVSL